ncbi:D-alanyl-D-alanine carboxypeptidase/D-alanyl-D-alanine endopeptidase [Pseudaestuariivita atlantica]|uniref:D-alanyl-D-alanine carboxypeptidase n=1 Tax=Pseudaestuariivita atlantica TaxID=1317121 RepID=A0A0L1JR31_9RHOB|nr:D-alanyl-D-alanine carboxypeptidase/D-alanyl-D-alanine-endopeptidase [Pseudaestuariivita atlantica]KNG94196.1 D-alanyl-D-alanine carboxypeptidase [Pseudaestuariivita atlantica]
MSSTYSRRFFLAALMASAATSACANAPETSLKPMLRPAPKGPNGDVRPQGRPRQATGEELIAEAGLSGKVGFVVADARTGQIREAVNADLSLPPASVMKALTGLYALDVLGPSHTFRTRLLATGPVAGGIVQGDLVLAGGGDPTLDTDALAALAAALKAAGVTGVTGAFRVWDGALPRLDRIDGSQPEHVGYNPALSGLNLNFNRVHFEWRRTGGSYRVTMDARSETLRPDVSMAKMVIADRDIPVYTYRNGGAFDSWSVARGALGNGGARWLPVRKPALYAGDVFRTVALGQGITLPSPVLATREPGGRQLAAHASPPVTEIVRDMLKFSTNLTAEVLGLAATARRTGRMPATLRASASEMRRWAAAKYALTDATLVDHSGLGDASRLSATAMTEVLMRARPTGIGPLMRKIQMRGPDRKVIKGHPVKVRAKTGTLNFVSALAGYATAADGTPLVFTIFAADTRARAAIAKSDRESPPGARRYNRNAKALQQKLLQRWGAVYGS